MSSSINNYPKETKIEVTESMSSLSMPVIVLLNEAKSNESFIGSTCCQLAFELLDGTDHSSLEDLSIEGSDEKLEKFKNTLLSMKGEQMEEISFLLNLPSVKNNLEIFRKLYSCGMNHLKFQLSKCHPLLLPHVIQKKVIDLDLLIRINLEINPNLSADKFISQLKSILNLTGQTFTEVGMKQHIKYLQSLLIYPSHKSTFLQLDKADEIYIFLSNILEESGMSKEDLSDKIETLLEECQSKKMGMKLFSLKKKLKEGSFTKEELPKDKSALSDFLGELYTMSAPLGSECFETLFSTFFGMIVDYNTDKRSSEEKIPLRSILLFHTEFSYGLSTFLTSIPKYKEISTLLENYFKQNPLSTHEEAVEVLQKKLFSDYPHSKMIEKIYKTWWFTAHLRLSPQSQIDRLIDWYALNILVKSKGWTLSCDAFTEILKDKIHQNHPTIPFSSVHAWAIYHKLHDLHRKSMKSL